MRKLYLLVLFLIILFSILILYKPKSKSTLGKYYGISKDKAWQTTFNVFKKNNETLLKGDVICLDNKVIKKLDIEDIDHNQITLFKSNGHSFGGNCIYVDNKFTIINYVIDDGATYDRMLIVIGDYKVELDITKNK